MTGLLVSEWIEATGGAERVLDRLAGLFPDADMLCLWNDAPERFSGRRLRDTWLAGTPLRGHKALALPLMPATWRVPQYGYDWAIVSSHAFAHHVNVGSPDVAKYVYVHTPARYLWAPELDARGANRAARVAGPLLRAIDRRAAKEATSIAANSRYVADRVERSWDRPATVIHPPVDVTWIQGGGWAHLLTDEDRRVLDSLPADFVLGVSRFIPYKRLDVVMKTGELLGLPVVIAGEGPLDGHLRAMAEDVTVPVHFSVQCSDALVYALMERARVFVFPPIEDFGMVAVEAMATGTPVMANRIGGAGESVEDGVGGALFDPRSPAEIRAAAEACAGLSSAQIAAHAQRFDASEFDRALEDWVSPHIALART
ncbi:MAG TPA: glycosyltransferase [Microbacterium sp.]|nr:glycosyltransferase [Microbacterium sp.]